MSGPGDAGLFPGSLPGSAAGAAWAWLLCALVGASLLGRLRATSDEEEDALRPVAWAVAGGGVLSALALLAGVARALTPAGVLAGAGALTLVGAAAGGRALVRALATSWRLVRASVAADGAAGWAGIAGLAIVVGLASPWSWVPTVHHDDLVYHLGLPRQALLSGAWPAWPHFHHSVMPAAWETLYLVPLSLRGGCGPQLMNLVALACFAGTAAAFARRGGGGPAARVAATLLVSSGAVVAAAWTAGNDLFTGLALALALDRALRPGGRAVLEAGACLGAACAAKYTAWPGAAALVVAVLLAGGPLAGRARRAATVALIGLALILPWSLRSLALTGSPAYPAAHSWLGGRPWDDESARQLATDSPVRSLSDEGLGAVTGTLGEVLVDQQRLGEPGGMSRVLIVLGLLGLALAGRLRDGRALVAFLLVASAGWFATSPMLRFFLGPSVVLAAFAACVLDASIARLAAGRRAAVIVAVAGAVAGVVGWQGALDRWFTRRGLPPASVLRDREDLLLDSLYLARAEEVLASLPEDARIACIAEARVALVPRVALVSSALDPPLAGEWLRGVTRPEDVPARLAPHATHVLFNAREAKRWDERYGLSRRMGKAEARALREWLTRARPVATWGGSLALFEVTP